MIDFKTSSQAANDMLLIGVNDEFAKAFGGEHDWMQYAHSFVEDGEYNVSLSYVKDFTESDGEDCVWIDSVALVTGAEAEAAVSANPVYPVADEFSITIVSEDARKLVFNDPAGMLDPGPEFECYNSESGEIKFLIQLPAEIDPETVYLFDYFNGYQALLDNMTEEGYLITYKTGDLLDKYRNPFTLVGCESLYFELPRNVFLLFISGDQLDALIKESRTDSNGNAFLKWAYADEVDVDKFFAEKIEADFSELVDGDAQYNIFVQDQNGEPVPGVTLQVCDDASCMVYTSDESGSCSFSLPVKTYELHVLMVPEGFDSDNEVYELPVVGGDMLITLNKN